MLWIDSASNLDEDNLKLFILTTLLVCGALPLGKYFAEPKISKTVIFNTKLTF